LWAVRVEAKDGQNYYFAGIGISPTQTATAGSQVSLGDKKITKVWTNYPMTGDEWQVLSEHCTSKITIEELHDNQWQKNQIASLAIPSLPSYLAIKQARNCEASMGIA